MPKLAARLMRALMYSMMAGPMAFLGSFWMVTAINKISGSTVVDPTGVGLGFFAMGFVAPLAIELSKDLEEEK